MLMFEAEGGLCLPKAPAVRASAVQSGKARVCSISSRLDSMLTLPQLPLPHPQEVTQPLRAPHHGQWQDLRLNTRDSIRALATRHVPEPCQCAQFSFLPLLVYYLYHTPPSHADFWKTRISSLTRIRPDGAHSFRLQAAAAKRPPTNSASSEARAHTQSHICSLGESNPSMLLEHGHQPTAA